MAVTIIGSLAAGYNMVSCTVRREFALSWYLPFTKIPVLQVADSIGGWFDLCFVMCLPIGLKDKHSRERVQCFNMYEIELSLILQPILSSFFSH